MRSSLMGLHLLLACALVLGIPVTEERKECCGPGVPPEESCCPEGNSTLEELGNSEEKMEVPNQALNLEEQEELEELEERARRHRGRLQSNFEIGYEMSKWKQQALDYFNKHNPGPFYRPIEDTEVKAKMVTGTMMTFTVFLVGTNCTREEGLGPPRHFRPISSVEEEYSFPLLEEGPCVALPKDKQKKLKCRFDLFMGRGFNAGSVVRHFCEPLVILEDSKEIPDLNEFIDAQMQRHYK